jgi:hypothetical protein
MWELPVKQCQSRNVANHRTDKDERAAGRVKRKDECAKNFLFFPHKVNVLSILLEDSLWHAICQHASARVPSLGLGFDRQRWATTKMGARILRTRAPRDQFLRPALRSLPESLSGPS